MARSKKQQPKKRVGKPVNFRLIPEEDGLGHVPEPYRLLKEVRDMEHGDTHEAKVALAWRLNMKPDQDGRIELGRCIKCSDLAREFSDYDFINVINKIVWDDMGFTVEKKKALLDHEMMHIAPTYNEETGEVKYDERGRMLFRMRKHDIEEFSAIVARHGFYKSDLERFARVVAARQANPLFNQPPADEAGRRGQLVRAQADLWRERSTSTPRR
jgi:hypothetical protein